MLSEGSKAVRNRPIFAGVVGCLLGAAAAPGATLVSHVRVLNAYARVSDDVETIEFPQSTTHSQSGSYDESIESHIDFAGLIATGGASQQSNVLTGLLTLAASSHATVEVAPPASGRAEGSTRMTVTLDVAQSETWTIQANASVNGALSASEGSVRLARGLSVLRELDTSQGSFTLSDTLVLSPGRYEIDVRLSSVMDSDTGPGTTGLTLSFSFERSQVACAGDANGDGVVDFLDLNVVLSQYGQSGAPGSFTGDLDDDGDVDFEDLNTVLSDYGKAC